MAARDNLHSRVVAWLKVVLPLLALALLSTLFLVARSNDPDATLPYSRTDLAQMASEQRVERPSFAGVTREGRRIEVAAETAVPHADDQNVIEATALSGTLHTGQDGRIDVSSRKGTLFAETARATLRGQVEIVTTTGYTIRTEELETALDRVEMATPGPVAAEGPLGRIDAGRLTVVPGARENEVAVVFKDGVKLVYVPPSQ